MKIIFYLILFISSLSYACCADQGHNFYLIGEVNGNVLFIELIYTYNCGPTKDNKTIYDITGEVNLLEQKNDTLLILEKIKKFNLETLNEVFTPKLFEDQLLSYYHLGLKTAKALHGFKLA